MKAAAALEASALAAPLRTCSTGSLLRGTVAPEALAARAAALGYRALGLADRDGLYAAAAFARACGTHGIQPVLGAELSAGPVGKAQAARRIDPPAAALAFARDRAGYGALCRLLTARHLEPALPWDEACARAEGLDFVALDAAALQALAARGVSRLALGVASPGNDGAPVRDALAIVARVAPGAGVIATGRVARLEAAEGDDERARVLAALRANTLVERVGMQDPGEVLAPAARWHAAWHAAGPEAAAALAANAALVAGAHGVPELGVPRFPQAPVPDGETPYSHLYARCHEGLARRYRPVTRAAVHRLARELEVIDRLGFTPYFVLVADIVGFARAQGIPSVGRGSGAASIVSYVLGITNVDPLRYRLAFERFLHDERRDCPDLDIDLCWIRRDDVIAHVYRTYGAERVAMISTHCTLGARGAFREAAQAHGIPPDVVDRIAKFVPHDPEKPLAELLARPAARLGLDLAEPSFRGALRDAPRLAGLTDHLGVHPCGLVIADTALTDYTPLEEATKGLVVSQMEMRQIESLGLVKMDLLGNRALTEIGDAAAHVARLTGTMPRLEPVPDGDAKTVAMLRQGDALGLFQLESPGMRNLLVMMDTRTLDDAIAALSLIRPGPAGAGMKDLYVRIQRGLEAPRTIHPRLHALLAPQKGVLLYEEDVMGAVAALTDSTLGRGDLFRRALAGTRTVEQREPLRRWFAARARTVGLSAAEVETAWREIARFGAYAFCRAHAAGYGVLAWQAAYLRAHWPAAWATALCDHHAGMYGLWVHVADLQRHGVRFALPCVQRSLDGAALEGDAVHGPVRIGLGRVRDLGERTRARTLETRATEGPFASLADFLGRVRPDELEAQRLVEAGAFDWTGRTRASLLLEVEATRARYLKAEPEGAFRVRRAPIALPELPEFAPYALRAREWDALELGVIAHPLAAHAPELWPADLPAAAEAARAPGDAACALGERIGKRVQVTGIMAAARRVPTKQGGRMLFLTLDDGTGLAECTLFPDAYARAQPRLAGAGPFVATGRVESQHGAVTVNVESVEPWSSGDQRRQVLVGRDARPAGRMEESRWLRQAP
jgi:error-prone DNA polymerase